MEGEADNPRDARQTWKLAINSRSDGSSNGIMVINACSTRSNDNDNGAQSIVNTEFGCGACPAAGKSRRCKRLACIKGDMYICVAMYICGSDALL